jgi:heterodisulfide reductase subunit C
MTIYREDLEPRFKFEVAELPGAEDLKRCFACGSCTGICPVSRENSGYDPRKIIHMVILGLKGRLLASEMIWQCTHCDTCEFICPQGVRMSNIINALRQMAVQGEYVDIATLQEWGRVAKVKPGKCVGCLTCVRVCPFEAVYVGKEKRAFVKVDPLKCRGCGLCTAECPRGAIVI